MRVLLINKYLFPRGGDASITLSTGELLKEKGHEVYFWGMNDPCNPPLPFSEFFISGVDYYAKTTLKNKITLAFRVIYSFHAKKQLKKMLELVKPDIIHLHNIAHQISPSILHTIKKTKIPVVMTLHDFKLVCPYWYLLRKTKPCELCRNGAYFWCFIHRCTMGSYMKSFINTMEMYIHHKLLHIYSLVDIYISPSRFLINKTKEMGFIRKIYYLNNFININDYLPVYTGSGTYLCYFGRISEEKGLYDLADAVKTIPVKLKIIGSGRMFPALLEKIKKEHLSMIELTGHMEKERLLNEVRNAAFVILPSRCYENNPMSILESFALGKPVIGSRIGGIPELVKDYETGLTFEPGNSKDLHDRICFLLNNPGEIVRMGKKSREFAEKLMNSEEYYQKLIHLYKFAMKKYENNAS
ncbi:MAG: glycosyltransferase family 4 protein [Spirochaetales bacterium]|nr:glycosyltransferase family 4 protein [Spirochaetales bacterium]